MGPKSAYVAYYKSLGYGGGRDRGRAKGWGAFGRRIADYGYVSGTGKWQMEYFPYDGPPAVYSGPPDSGGYWTVFRNHLGSMRWDASNGARSDSDALYDPHGNDWYICTIYGPGTSTFGLFDPFCNCLPTAIGPGSRAYNPLLGRWMGKRPFSLRDLLNPRNLNPYAYAGNDPINNVDSGSGPHQPPLPGLDQLQNLSAQFKELGQSTDPMLNLGGAKVKVTLQPGTYDGNPGAQMQADPQGCANCSWAQTVSRTGYGAEAPHTDRTMAGQPTYPNSYPTNQLYDFPNAAQGHAGTFRAVSSVGFADPKARVFDVIGSMTWGYDVNENGNVTPYGPRVATPAEQFQSIQILQLGSPTWIVVGP